MPPTSYNIEIPKQVLMDRGLNNLALLVDISNKLTISPNQLNPAQKEELSQLKELCDQQTIICTDQTRKSLNELDALIRNTTSIASLSGGGSSQSNAGEPTANATLGKVTPYAEGPINLTDGSSNHEQISESMSVNEIGMILKRNLRRRVEDQVKHWIWNMNPTALLTPGQNYTNWSNMAQNLWSYPFAQVNSPENADEILDVGQARAAEIIDSLVHQYGNGQNTLEIKGWIGGSTQTFGNTALRDAQIKKILLAMNEPIGDTSMLSSWIWGIIIGNVLIANSKDILHFGGIVFNKSGKVLNKTPVIKIASKPLIGGIRKGYNWVYNKVFPEEQTLKSAQTNIFREAIIDDLYDHYSNKNKNNNLISREIFETYFDSSNHNMLSGLDSDIAKAQSKFRKLMEKLDSLLPLTGNPVTPDDIRRVALKIGIGNTPRLNKWIWRIFERGLFFPTTSKGLGLLARRVDWIPGINNVDIRNFEQRVRSTSELKSDIPVDIGGTQHTIKVPSQYESMVKGAVQYLSALDQLNWWSIQNQISTRTLELLSTNDIPPGLQDLIREGKFSEASSLLERALNSLNLFEFDQKGLDEAREQVQGQETTINSINRKIHELQIKIDGLINQIESYKRYMNATRALNPYHNSINSIGQQIMRNITNYNNSIASGFYTDERIHTLDNPLQKNPPNFQDFMNHVDRYLRELQSEGNKWTSIPQDNFRVSPVESIDSIIHRIRSIEDTLSLSERFPDDHSSSMENRLTQSKNYLKKLEQRYLQVQGAKPTLLGLADKVDSLSATVNDPSYKNALSASQEAQKSLEALQMWDVDRNSPTTNQKTLEEKLEAAREDLRTQQNQHGQATNQLEEIRRQKNKAKNRVVNNPIRPVVTLPTTISTDGKKTHPLIKPNEIPPLIQSTRSLGDLKKQGDNRKPDSGTSQQTLLEQMNQNEHNFNDLKNEATARGMPISVDPSTGKPVIDQKGQLEVEVNGVKEPVSIPRFFESLYKHGLKK